ncbi:MAG TPA: C4-type zinc ribbon domain-containing protein [Terriglobales bacterium]|nr:C4-type zinc ribbon domain-containing protein [Terriglobales bacterium]
MLPDIEKLFELQAADKEIRKLHEEVAALPKRVAAIEEKLAGTKAHLEKARAAAKADEANRKKFETAIQDLQGKISKYRDQSLDVKTNDQYKALLHEIQFAEQEIRINEDRILEVMVNVEVREKEVKAAEAELKAETAEIEKEKEEARKVTAEDQKKLAEWNAKRDGLRREIPEDLLRHYERVMKFRGSGLAEAREQKCMGCQVMLRPQTYNEVRIAEKVVVCESCQRILYFDPANEVKVEQQVAEAVHARRRPRPKADAPQAWFYRHDYGEEGEVLLVFTNGGGTSTRRVYEMHTGRQIGDVLGREGAYRLAFPEDLTDSAIRLNGHWDEEEMDEWGSEIPSNALDVLHNDLRAAQRERHAPAHKQRSATPAEHSTAR